MKLLLLLLLPITGFDQEFYIPDWERPDAIPVIRQGECESALLESLYPESVVKAGLEALLAGKVSADPSSTRACTDELLKAWDKELAPPAVVALKRERISGVDGPVILDLAKIYVEPIRPDPRPKDAAWAKARCFNPHPKDSNDHRIHAQSHAYACHDTWLSDEEGRPALAKFKEEAEKFEQGKVKHESEHLRLYELFRLPGVFDGVSRDSWIPLTEELKCYSSIQPVPASVKQEKHQCGGKWLTLEQRTDKLQKLEKLIGTPEEAEKRVFEKLREFERGLAQDLAEKNPERTRNLGWKHLFTSYQRFLTKGGGSLREFCKQNEASQERDRRFLENIRAYEGAQTPDSDPVAAYAEKNFGMSKAERLAIHAFSRSYFNSINPAMRRGKLSEVQEVFRDSLDHALGKLPNHGAEPVVRYATLPKAVLDQHEPGKVVCYDAYSSASSRADWVWHNSRQRFLIYTHKSGRAVDLFSRYPNEKEVVIQAGTCFKVIAREPSATGTLNFVLAESDKDGNVLAKVPEVKP